MAAQAGWYVDPRDARQYRYWDGERWSQSTQPIPEPTDTAGANDSNGVATGSLSSGGAKDPVGAAAFDQAAEQTPASSDGVLADFMWTSGFGETPDDPAANAGPTMFTPGDTGPAAPRPPAPPAPAASAPAPSAPPAPAGPFGGTAESTSPAFPPPPAAPTSAFGAPTDLGTTSPSAPVGGGSLFSAPPSGAAPQFDPTPSATPTDAGGSLFAPIDPSLQPIFGSGDHADPAFGGAAPKRSRKGKADKAAPEPPAPAPVSLSAGEASAFRMPEPDPFVPRPDISVEPPVGPADAAGAVKIKMDRKSDRKPKPPKTKGAPKQKAQKGKDESKSKLPVLLGALAVVVLGAGAFVLLSGGDDEVDTGADVAGTTVEKTSTSVVAPTTTAAVVATTAAASETTAAATPTTVAAADPAAIAALQSAFDAEATRACDVIKADPGLFTENVIQYQDAWAAIPKTYADLQKSVNDCSFQARDEALKRVAEAEGATTGG